MNHLAYKGSEHRKKKRGKKAKQKYITHHCGFWIIYPEVIQDFSEKCYSQLSFHPYDHCSWALYLVFG